MPVKRRTQKRRLDPRGEAEAWSCVFDSGWDFFDDLARFGVEVDEHGRPQRETAEAAWNRVGALFLADRADPREPWALRQFGAPHA